MNSRRGGGKGKSASLSGGAGVGGHSSHRGKSVEGSNSGNPGQLIHDASDASLDPAQDGEWEFIGKKSKNRGGASAAKPWSPTNSAPRTWGPSEGVSRQGRGINGGANRASGNNWNQAADSRRPAGRGNTMPPTSQRGWEAAYMAPPPSVPSPLTHGWQWAARGVSSGSQPKTEETIIPPEGSVGGYGSESNTVPNQPEYGSDEDDLAEDTDEDLSDDYDSDVSQKSHETRKKNKWFKVFFESLDKLTVEEINEQTRQWHCPACHDGPGAIEWYKGLQPLMTHAKTKGSKRVKLHRELATLLEEELHRRGTSVIPAGEAFGKWKGLRETVADHEIVWPPMVVVMNTLLELDENEKWLGMGNQELLEYFSTYAAVKARHSYGPHGHRGMSVLMFEGSAMGYLEAERLHKHFADEGRDRDAWERHPNLFYPGGKRQLYGYLAHRGDVDSFNQHCQGKSRLKYELRSYQEMVVGPMKQMSEDNQQLIWLKNKVVKQEQRSKALEETFGVVTQKLRETMAENRIVRLRTMIQHEENKEEMDHQERFFKDQIEKVHKMTEEKERNFEKLLQDERAKVKQSSVDAGVNDDRRLRNEEIERFLASQKKGVEEFEEEREKLIHTHEEKKVELRKKHLEEEVLLEKDFDTALTALMKKFTPGTFEEGSSS